MNNVFKVPESLASKYHGSGHALAAVVNEELIDIVYISDIINDYDETDLASIINDDRLGPSVRYLQSLGNIHFGMLSSWEFVEL